MTRPLFSRLVLLAASGMAVSVGVSHAERLPPALCSGSLFGPETFHPPRGFITNQDSDQSTVAALKRGTVLRGTRRTIALQGHTPPFVLRARNGDGGSRVAAAWVWLDGQQLLGPDDFSLNIIEHERVVDVREGSVLRVQVVGTADSTLSVEIVGERPDTEQIVLTPDGGHYELKSGAVLDVPPGAVDEATRIAVCGVSASSAQPRLDANVLQPQYCAAGIQGVPSGLTFNVPVTVTLPAVPSRSPADVPVAFTLEPRGGAFSLVPTDLQHDPTNGLIRARISHFTEWEFAYNEDAIKMGYDCRDKANWCRCYGLREIIQADSDYTVSDECYVTTSDLLVTLLECAGQPQEPSGLRAREVPKIRIDPEPHPIEISMCDTGRELRAVGIHATEPRERAVLNLTWESLLPDVASFDSPGFVKPHADGCVYWWSKGDRCSTAIYAHGSCGAQETTDVEVIGPYTVDPLEAPPTLVTGGSYPLTTRARDKNKVLLGCEPIDWKSSDRNVVTVLGGVLTAQRAGVAVITARARHNPNVESAVPVKVRSNDECDKVACTLMVGVAVQPTVQRCSGTADACVYTGDASLHLSAWLRNDTTGKKVKRELAWAAVPITGSVELAPAVDPDPAVTRVQVKGFVPGMATMQALDPSSGRSASLRSMLFPGSSRPRQRVRPQPRILADCPVALQNMHGRATRLGSAKGSSACACRGRGPRRSSSGPRYRDPSRPGARAATGLELVSTWDHTFFTNSPLTVSGSTVSYHWAWDGPCNRFGGGLDHQEHDLTRPLMTPASRGRTRSPRIVP